MSKPVKINELKLMSLTILAITIAMFGVACAPRPSSRAVSRCSNDALGLKAAAKVVDSATEASGEVTLGDRKVPIVNPVNPARCLYRTEKRILKLIPPTSGETLSKTPQPIPGGLGGIVPPDGSSPLVRAVMALFFENGLTGVNATVELARPASEVLISEVDWRRRKGGAEDADHVHLENPLLGGSCYIGSSGVPVTLELTSGKTSPPRPGQPIKGTVGSVEFLEGGTAPCAPKERNLSAIRGWRRP